MQKVLIAGAALAMAGLPAQAEMLIAARTLRAQSVITANDLILRDGPDTGLSDPADVIGQEARVTIYAGRPLRPGDIGPPALIERNQIVPLIYESNILRIETEARALDRAGLGEVVRVLNLSSRNPVMGEVQENGSVLVRGTK